MGKIRILAICPYPGMRDLINELAVQYPQIEVTAFLGDLQKGLEVARKETEEKNYDYIISRGGTAELIAAEINVPLLEMPITIGDALQAIKMVGTSGERSAIVGFSDIINTSRSLLEILGEERIGLYTIGSAEEAECVVEELKKEKISVIVGDTIATKTAEKLGMASVLITSCSESMQSVIRQIIKLNNSLSKTRNEIGVFHQVAARDHKYIYACDIRGREMVSTIPETRENESLKNFIFRKRPEIFAAEETELYFKASTVGYFIRSWVVEKDSFNPYLIATIDSSDEKCKGAEAIQVLERAYFTESMKFEYEHNQLTGALAEQTAKAAETDSPVIIIGEDGTEKELAALAIYSKNISKFGACYTMDMKKMRERDWKWLFDSMESPVSGSGHFMCFTGAEHMPAEKWQMLESHIRYANLGKRNKLVFCYTSGTGRTDRSGMMDYFLKSTSVNAIYVPSLREQMSKITSTIAMHVNNYNCLHGTQKIGLTEEALSLVKEYDWPGNFGQLRRVINELLETSSSPYIQADDMKAYIDKEKDIRTTLMRSKDGYEILEGTLDEINRNIVKRVLEEEDNNKKNAAERLGISRTTLWRLIRDNEI